MGGCLIEKSFLTSCLKQLDVKDSLGYNKEIERIGKTSTK